jgi:hypothetical protein
MAEARNVILAISPGTKSLGIVVVKNNQLMGWHTKTYPGKWTKSKSKLMLQAIYNLAKYYEVTTLIIKRVDPIRSSDHLLSLVEKIKAQASEQKLHVKDYSIYDLQEFCDHARNIQRAIADSVVEIFPELKYEYLQDRNNRNPYYYKMFEAALAAYRCSLSHY